MKSGSEGGFHFDIKYVIENKNLVSFKSYGIIGCQT